MGTGPGQRLPECSWLHARPSRSGLLCPRGYCGHGGIISASIQRQSKSALHGKAFALLPYPHREAKGADIDHPRWHLPPPFITRPDGGRCWMSLCFHRFPPAASLPGGAWSFWRGCPIGLRGLANGKRAGQEWSTFKCGSLHSLVFLVFQLVFSLKQLAWVQT